MSGTPKASPDSGRLLHEPAPGAAAWEHTFTGQSRIKLRVRLPITLQPVSWCAEPRSFRSCLEVAPVAAVPAVSNAPPASPSAPSSSPAAPAAAASSRKRALSGEDSEPRRQQRQRLDSPSFDEGSHDAAARDVADGAGSGGGRGGPGSPSAVASPSGGRGRSSGGAAAHSHTEDSASASTSASGSQGAPTSSYSHAELEDLYRSAVSIDLEHAPVGRQTWLSATVVDAMLVKLAKAYPDTYFLPCAFTAWDLPTAVRRGEDLRALRVHDILTRQLRIVPDAIPVCTAVAGYDPLPTTYKVAQSPTGSSISINSFNAGGSSSSSSSSGGSAAAAGNGNAASSVSAAASPLFGQSAGAGQSSSAAALNSSSSVAPFAQLAPSLYSIAPSPLYSILVNALAAATASSSGGKVRGTEAAASSAGSTAPAISVSANGGAGSQSPPVPALPLSWSVRLSNAGPPSGVCYVPPSFASANRPLVFFLNIGNLHWNLIRVDLGPRKRLEVYEPMGKPSTRKTIYRTDGLSLRSVPSCLLQWLDAVCPLPTEGGWRARAISAVTSAHQANGYDCAVACLLYAEKCAQNHEAEDICLNTCQQEITEYRSLLQSALQAHVHRGSGASSGAQASVATAEDAAS